MTDRDEFEKYLADTYGKPIDLKIESDKSYCNESIQDIWEGWKAALATRPPVDVQAIEAVIANLDCTGSAGTDHYSAEHLLDVMNDASVKLAAAIGAKV